MLPREVSNGDGMTLAKVNQKGIVIVNENPGQCSYNLSKGGDTFPFSGFLPVFHIFPRENFMGLKGTKGKGLEVRGE